MPAVQIVRVGDRSGIGRSIGRGHAGQLACKVVNVLGRVPRLVNFRQLVAPEIVRILLGRGIRVSDQLQVVHVVVLVVGGVIIRVRFRSLVFIVVVDIGGHMVLGVRFCFQMAQAIVGELGAVAHRVRLEEEPVHGIVRIMRDLTQRIRRLNQVPAGIVRVLRSFTVCVGVGQHVTQGVEGVGELIGGRSVGQAEAQVVRGDHVVAVREQRNQVAEHERAGREAVQQHDGRSIGRARLPVEQLPSADGGVAVVNGGHRCSLSGRIASNRIRSFIWLG